MPRFSSLISCLVMLMMMISQTAVLAAPRSGVAPSTALLTEAHGNVFKRDFTDWTRETMSDPIPAAVGDALHEGMQVGTGDKSWAQLKWSNMSARAWANSVYAIAPTQRLVYLVGGEMLYQLDKNRKDKSNYFVWTNLLQARIRGTTVLFQATKEKSRITVLEGTVEVFNKVDRSLVTLSPGVVYEVSMKQTTSAAPNGASSFTAQTLTRITSEKSQPVPIFDTAKTTATITPVDPTAITSHPLLTSFEAALPSLPLVTTAMNGVQAVLETATGSVSNTVNGLLKENFSILSAPRALTYSLGSEVGNVATIKPGVFEFFGPNGVVNPDGKISTFGPSPASLPNVGAVTAPLSTLNSAAPFAPIGTGSVGSLTSGIGAAGAASSITSTVNGATSRVGSTVGAATGTIGGVTGAVGGTVGGVVGGVGGALNGLTGGLTGGLLGH